MDLCPCKNIVKLLPLQDLDIGCSLPYASIGTIHNPSLQDQSKTNDYNCKFLPFPCFIS